MATDDPATLYCRFIDSVINHRRLEHLDQFLSTDVVEHTPERSFGINAARQGLERWLAAFPNLHLVIEDLVVDGQYLMARLLATGTYHGPLAGSRGRVEVAMPSLPPTGSRVRLPMFEAWLVPRTHCVERWVRLAETNPKRTPNGPEMSLARMAGTWDATA